MKIFKYPLRTTDHQYVWLPEGFSILSVQEQRGDRVPELMLWAMVEERNPEAAVEILIYGTGHNLDNVPKEYLNTVQDYNGLVWHIFRKISG